MDIKFDADAAATVLRVIRVIPRREQPEFLRALLAHSIAYLCMLDGDEPTIETLYWFGDALLEPERRARMAEIRAKDRGHE